MKAAHTITAIAADIAQILTNPGDDFVPSNAWANIAYQPRPPKHPTEQAVLSFLAGLATIAGALASLALLALGLAGFTPEVEPGKRDRYRAVAYAAAILGSAALAGSLAALTFGSTLLAAIVGGAPIPFALAVVAWIESRRAEAPPPTHPGLAHPEPKPTGRTHAVRISRADAILPDAAPTPSVTPADTTAPALVPAEPSRPIPPSA